jgi:exodeoxyribonuclease V beta subunit
MKALTKFDLLEAPLLPGTTLIEASAGTGKTYTIAGVVLRLILEQALPVERILVTTYTELATAELRDRIRRLLRETLTAFTTGGSPNEFIEGLRRRNQHDPRATDRLRLALQTFDEAAIYTIHGFCQRVLKDRAFESGALFDAELITDQSMILIEMVDDFWRSHFYTASPLLVAAATTHKLTPASLRRDLEDLIKKPTLEIRPALDDDDDDPGKELLATWEMARSCWLRHGVALRTIFQNLAWAKQHYNDSDVTSNLERLDRMFAASAIVDGNSEVIGFFSSSKLAKHTRVRHNPPKHEFFDLCERLVALERTFILRLRAKFLRWARKEIGRRKLDRNVLFFDDLLSLLHDSLGRPGGEQLAESIRKRFSAALIDEFQDTDPIQYAIFERIYSGDSEFLFFIGDPKQAIYGFRGADVFTYLAAAREANRRYTLTKNWRSESGLVRAVNTLFGLNTNTFLLEGISFEPVEAASKADEKPLTLKGKRPAPFQLWLEASEASIANKDAEPVLLDALASEIVRLLESSAMIGDRPLAPRDLAILVGTNREARQVQETLLERRVPTVIYGAANVFESAEAKELLVILAAVIEPGQERAVRAALATEILGLTSEELLKLETEDQLWEVRLQQFQRYHELWRERGFIQMLRTVVSEQGVRPRLLSYPDGERRLTNLLHLGELLHRMCVEDQLGMSGLFKRLGELIRSPEIQSEEYELRLESDEAAARIITIHKSKGLQYGIVFCPFAWKNPPTRSRSNSRQTSKQQEKNVIFHDGDKIILDLESLPSSVAAQEEETFQEKMRLLYVALTRAEHRCALVWGNFKNGQKSAPAHLFGPWPETMAGLRDQPNIVSLPLPEATKSSYRSEEYVPSEFQARRFERTLDRAYGIASFTRLLSDQIEEPEVPEDDAIETIAPERAAVVDDSALKGIAAFSRGSGPGTCLHHIFEELDFTNPSDLGSLVTTKLQAFGITGFDQVITETVEKVLAAPLDPKQPDLKLANIGRGARLSELEFYFPLGRVTHQKLAGLFPDERLHFQTMSGFMKGFVDLIFRHRERFYIVDWKSNWLGPSPESYSQETMDEEMESKFYRLQLSIYTVALHRFLRARMPGYSYETHFGGVFYVFLRGIEPGRPDLGIWRTRLEPDFVDRLSGLFDHDA